MDLFEKIKKNRGPIGQHAKDSHGYFTFPKLEGEIGSKMVFRGKERLVWSLNNYLGLANHPDVRKADAAAAAEYGFASPMGARMMSGNTNYHEQLENELSAFMHKEDTILLNFGYQGMVSAIDCLVDRHDVIVYDSESHACIIDGVRLHMGKRFVFPHNDIANCEKQLERATRIVEETGGSILVITEGVFGMRGDQGKLKEIVALKKKYNFRLFVDDAHGFGTMGKTGAGTGEEQGVQDEIDVYFGTFAKSMAMIGGFISSKEDVVEYLRYNMRSQIFAKSMPAALVKGALKRLELLRSNPSLKNDLWKIVNALQSGLKEAGFEIGNTESPVTPVYMSGSIPEATNMIYDLRENSDIFCSMVVYPVVPKGVIILRLIPTAVHTLEDVKYTIEAFRKAYVKLKAGEYMSDKIAAF
ncbi:MAG: aminotransferase class I/II-fold pyridoxal phosphate-dependent enzyme [Bacteroidota bacterium]|uniref:aminotransferase class I/II-fold pyridoxal phosphate-dependent enzyme n=1 Tax=Candidatus Pollutiaquabacter sp. TaxID=3416354 RepID=UPI001A370E30|nr:aminotransferase class I/II-fold pyridoxal phosphate-dependent enzyme [Bacteroidota bacterium]MBL7949536.1 aminotransferase class I/II-fold pyridoxal phosphate-dependent enzyme [Bacteroidia bacterium]HPD54881.1 aminotransferase class I/II-fold pyridoxal phosphate-dependent enzyme [Bacteroidia bacterium]HRU61168.1 aminotransferase class I/II-fold pyridoxal phosphate-dependent enzyme [Bacteroidia bacterium]